MRVNRFLISLLTISLFLFIIFFVSFLFREKIKPSPVRIRAATIESSLSLDDLGKLKSDPTSKVLGVSNKIEISKEFPPKKTEFGFNAFVINWHENFPTDSKVSIDVRTSVDGRVWSEWETLEEDPDSDGKVPKKENEKFSSLHVAYGSFIQQRVRLIIGQNDVGSLDEIKITYINSEGNFIENAWNKTYRKLSSLFELVDEAFAASTSKQPTDRPRIISRGEWGADPRLMKWQPEYKPTKKIIVHHTVTANNDPNPEATVRAIYYFHAVVRSWGDIGYNFLVDKRGNIYEGRYGGDGVVGGHVYHYNVGSVGVGVLGDYRLAKPTSATMNALQKVVVWKTTTNKIDPSGKSSFGPRGYRKYFPNVTFHGNLGLTECAGINLINFVPKLRKLGEQMPLELLKRDTKGRVSKFIFSSNKTVDRAIRELKRSKGVVDVQPNYIRKVAEFPSDGTNPNDLNYPKQWNLLKIGQKEAWEISTGSARVKVAVLDTGVAFEDYSDISGNYKKLPDFENTRFDTQNAYDYVNNDLHPNDDNGHGTAVTDIIASSLNNSLGNASISPNVTILPLKVANRDGYATDFNLAKSIKYASLKGAKVINISLGGRYYSSIVAKEINSAAVRGSLIIAAAGNNSNQAPVYPAAMKNVIAVGATGLTNRKTSYSSYGSWLDFMAPGGELKVDRDGNLIEDGIYLPYLSKRGIDYRRFNYKLVSGTSFSAAHVSGATALLASEGASLTRVIRALRSTAKDRGSPGFDAFYGWGIIQSHKALDLIK